MKFGYSILLGEYVSAKELEYDDCAQFQVVCPECREPIYKCVLEKHLTHYFSHYTRNKDAADVCELRVKHYTSNDINSHNHRSRHQRLAYFLAVFKKSLASLYKMNGSKVLRDMNKYPVITLLYREFLNTWLGANENIELFEDGLEMFVERLERAGCVLNTGFTGHIQMRIARDMWLTLNTTPERKNLKLLFNHAFYTEATDSLNAHKSGEELNDFFQSIDPYFVATFNTKNQKKSGKIVEDLRNHILVPGHKDSTLRKLSLLDLLLVNIFERMITVLTVLPYAEMLTLDSTKSTLKYPEPIINPSHEQSEKLLARVHEINSNNIGVEHEIYKRLQNHSS